MSLPNNACYVLFIIESSFPPPMYPSRCKFGGTCTEGPGLGEYSCLRKPEVSVLPFIDNRCNVGKLRRILGNKCRSYFLQGP